MMFLQIQHEVSNGNVVHRICSDACFTKFRATKGLKTNCCDNCGLYIYNKGLPLEYLFHEGQQKRFCNSACLNSYKKVCGVTCLGWEVSVDTPVLCSVWHRALCAIAGDESPWPLIADKTFKKLLWRNFEVANSIYLFCMGPILHRSMGQALSKLTVQRHWYMQSVWPGFFWVSPQSLAGYVPLA